MYLTFIKRIRTWMLIFAAILMICVALGVIIANAAYVPTNRDTRMPPESATYSISAENIDKYVFLTRVGEYEYWYREDRDIILIKDLRSGYAWKTGLDAPFSDDADKAAQNAKTDAEKASVEPKEDRLNATYIGFANSLVSAEIYDNAFNTNFVSSAGQKGVESTLMSVEQNHYRLDVDWKDIDLHVKVHVFLTDEGITYKIYDEDITGKGTENMASLIITPFFGASGGVAQYYDAEMGKFGPKQPKPMVDGYVFVPDGSGALIRFRHYNESLNKYIGNVYGVNPSEAMYYSTFNDGLMKKEPLMPVFGIAHGNEQSAFVAYADGGAEHMQIVVSPENNMTNYSFGYPRFVYNSVMHQVFNRKGEGYFRLFPDRLHFDLSISYDLLSGKSADYVGMALKYRDHLLETGVLSEAKVASDGEIPIRVDFVMSDVKKSVVGVTNVVTTTASQVGDIVRDMYANGIKNVNSGLLGFQGGGITTGKPWATDFTRAIGTKSDFKKLFDDMNNLGADVSFAQNYAAINERQMRLASNQAYHVNHWGLYRWEYDPPFLPVNEISYARPQKSALWFTEQSDKAINLGAKSVTAEGMTQLLLSHYGDDEISAEGTAELYRNTFAEVAGKGVKINATTPNMYLWKATDRFLQAPSLNTQYIIETDTVPFLQLVLNGTMEVYAPYSNFSFYTQGDILRMIDYNLYPSFVVTNEPAHLLSVTNSMTYYSTEYNIYRDIIKNVYTQVSAALSQVKGIDWIDRRVLANGVVVNTYANGVKIYINYTEDDCSFDGVQIKALSSVVVGGEGVGGK